MLKKGEATFSQHNGLVVVKYRAMKDRTAGKPKVVYVLSTGHAPAMGHTNKRDKDRNAIQKLTCINTYNYSIGGVDMLDQEFDGIAVHRKSYKWYKKLFLTLVMQCALSLHKLYRHNGGKDVFLYFLLDVYTQLLLNTPRLERPLRRPVVNSIVRLAGRNHWPGRRETPAQWKGPMSKLKRCRVCMAKGKKTQGGKEIKTVSICKSMFWWTRVVCGQRLFWNIQH